MPVENDIRWRAVGNVMMGNMTGHRWRVTGCVFPHWRRRQLFLPALECQCVFCVERNELLMLFSWIRVRARQCGIYGGQSSAGKGLSASTLVLPLSLLLRPTSMFHTYLQRFVLSKGWEIPEQLVTKVGSNKERRYFHCCYCLCLYQTDKRALPGNFQMLSLLVLCLLDRALL